MSATAEETRQRSNRLHDETDPQVAKAKVAAFPGITVYDAQYALQQIKESDLPEDTKNAVIVPIAKVLGWAEALSFVVQNMGYAFSDSDKAFSSRS